MSGHGVGKWILSAALISGLAASAWGAASAPKAGGILNAMHREDPPSLSIHEEATISTNWPMMSSTLR